MVHTLCAISRSTYHRTTLNGLPHAFPKPTISGAFRRIRTGSLWVSLPLFLWISASPLSLAQTSPPTVSASPNPIAVSQPDGSTLHIIGKGSRTQSYQETVDGYTVVKNNDSIYEYAKQTDNGNLIASGLKAHDPSDRSSEERKQLRSIPKHLRYQPPYNANKRNLNHP